LPSGIFVQINRLPFASGPLMPVPRRRGRRRDAGQVLVELMLLLGGGERGHLSLALVGGLLEHLRTGPPVRAERVRGSSFVDESLAHEQRRVRSRCVTCGLVRAQDGGEVGDLRAAAGRGRRR